MEALILGWYVLTATGSVQYLVAFAALAWVGSLFSPFFGILITVLVEVALISPPHGLTLFVLQNVRMQSAGKGERVGTVMDLYIGVMPFMVVMLVLIALLVAFPAIATWLPATMRG